MANHKHEFQSHNSPWTEMFAMHCQREDMANRTVQPSTYEEQQPTHDALADVYNRFDTAKNDSKRFFM